MTDSFYIPKYPIYASDYVDNDHVILAGGGGPSKSGYKNRIAVYSLSKSIQSSQSNKERQGYCTNEIVLADDEDAPSSIARHKDLILSGVNEAASSRKTGDNHHLRSFRITAEPEAGIKATLQHQILELDEKADDYQKVTKISPDGLYAGLLSAEGKLAIVSISNMTSVKQFTECADVEFVKDTAWIAKARNISIINLPKADESINVFDVSSIPMLKAYKISHIRLLSERSIVVALSGPKAYLAKFDLYKGSLAQQDVIYLPSRITGIYVSPAKTRIAVTTSDGKLTLYAASRLSKVKTYSKLHAFPISTVSFSPDSSQLITASIDEKVNIISIIAPDSSWVQMALIVLLLAVLYILYHYRGINRPSFEERVFQEL